MTLLDANEFTSSKLTGRADFSDSSDTVSIDNGGYEEIRGQYISLNSGDDIFRGTAFDSLGWDNRVNGNRGDDQILGNTGRDMLRGGKDDDGLHGGNSGSDWLRGDNGEDTVIGSWRGHNVLRGGKDSDRLHGGNRRELLVGDTGKDELTGNAGSDLFVLRTEVASDGLSNAAANLNQADRITDFNNAEDYIVLPKVSGLNKINIEVQGGDSYIFMGFNPGETMSFAGVIEGVVGIDPTRVIVGDQANAVAAGMNVDFHLANPNLDSFGI